MKKIFLNNFCLFSLLVAVIISLPVNAQIVYTDVNPEDTTSGTYNLDLNNDGTIDFVIARTSSIVQGKGHCQGQGPGTNHYFKISPLNNGAVVNYTENGNAIAAKMAADATIGASTLTWNVNSNQVMTSSVWGCNYFCPYGFCGYYWTTTITGYEWYYGITDGFLGLRFISGGHSFYGWVRISFFSGGNVFIVKDYAYNSIAGQAILAGQSSAEYLGVSTVADVLCAGKNVTIPYIIAGTFSASNVVTAELSDATGSFTNPVAIGNLTSNVSGNINAVIPALTPSGYAYRIRVRSSNPVRTSYPNSYNLIIIGGGLPDGTIAVAEPYSTNVCYGYVSLVSYAESETCNSYQWKLNGNDISGATSRIYNPIAAGDYTCIITNGFGSVASNIISVTADPFPVTIQSNSPCGASVNLHAGTPGNFTYQWKRNGIDIPGATSYDYTATTTGDYSCVYTNVCGSRTSNTITVYPDMAAAVITAAGPTTVCNGPVTLNANTGAGLSYEWYFNDIGPNNIYTLIPGATNSSYAASSTGYYYVKETNANGCTRNSNIIFTYIGMPVAIVTPPSATICQGNAITLYANISYGAIFSYQWMKDGVDIGGAKGRTYTAKKPGVYSVKVSIASGGCSSTSAGVQITNCSNSNTIASSNAIQKETPGLNEDFQMLSVAPNPIFSSTTISFALNESEKVSLRIYDMNGRLMKTLTDEKKDKGIHQLTWNTDKVIAGIYILRLQTSSAVQTRKLVVIK